MVFFITYNQIFSFLASALLWVENVPEEPCDMLPHTRVMFCSNFRYFSSKRPNKPREGIKNKRKEKEQFVHEVFPVEIWQVRCTTPEKNDEMPERKIIVSGQARGRYPPSSQFRNTFIFSSHASAINLVLLFRVSTEERPIFLFLSGRKFWCVTEKGFVLLMSL